MRDLLAEVADYYSQKLATHGATAQGVDWNGDASQHRRFSELCRIIDQPHFAIADLGCGYGALLDHLSAQYSDFHYTGVDVSADMIAAAQQRYAAQANAAFYVGDALPKSDYVVASGIFNVRQERSHDEWLAYILQTLDAMHAASARGFAANFLTLYSDTEKMRDYLYYADPLALFDHCKRHYSPHVALLHDYGLYEFTLLVRKQP